MPRLRNTTTGVVVNVDDSTAARLDGAWEPAEKPAEKPAPRRRKAGTESAE